MQTSDCADVGFEARDGRNGSIRAFRPFIDGKAFRFRKVFSAAVWIQASVCGLGGGGLLLDRACHSVPFKYDLRVVRMDPAPRLVQFALPVCHGAVRVADALVHRTVAEALAAVVHLGGDPEAFARALDELFIT